MLVRRRYRENATKADGFTEENEQRRISKDQTQKRHNQRNKAQSRPPLTGAMQGPKIDKGENKCSQKNKKKQPSSNDKKSP